MSSVVGWEKRVELDEWDRNSIFFAIAIEHEPNEPDELDNSSVTVFHLKSINLIYCAVIKFN